MRDRSYFDEAQHCRDLANAFVEGAEKPFLLRVADAFERLARNGSDNVVAPVGEPLKIENLPPVDTVRWTPRRKAEVVAAVARRLLSEGEACERYSLSAEELTAWQKLFDRSGQGALRVTRIQDYRARNGRSRVLEERNER